MLAKVLTGTTIGLEGVQIDVEVDIANRGFPTFTIVGLPGKAVDEAKDRVRTAIVNAGFDMPDSRITVNLAPADIPKTGACFDLPIAVGILVAAGLVSPEAVRNSIFIGELSLEGKVRKVPGVLPIAIMAANQRIERIFLPVENQTEAGLIEEVTVYPVHQLTELILHLNGQAPISPKPPTPFEPADGVEHEVDFADIKGQEHAKRALEIAAAGKHNVHFSGPPGTGKTLLSKSFPSILPPLERDEFIEVSKIYSIIGSYPKASMFSRPFRAPHHTTSRIGLIGGGSSPAPGEISLAHRGVLFLDEFPEFPRSVLESMRQPLEEGQVTISRASGSVTFPCRFVLIAASNPCPCGYLGHPKKRCTCMPGAVSSYQKRVSGPMLDRIDLHVHVPRIDEAKLMDRARGEPSAMVRVRVLEACSRQKERFKERAINSNSEMSSADIRDFCKLTEEGTALLGEATAKLSLSIRSYFRTIKIAQTIADLTGSDGIRTEHIAEALQFRTPDA